MTILLKENKQLAEICTLGIGGPAEFYIEVHNTEEMQQALKYCHTQKLRFFILGKGSNTLFDDRGFSGVVIHNKIEFLEEKTPGIFNVGGGYSFSLLGAKTARKGWSGLEFASGIPGTVGGAVFMNAGANGVETSDHLKSVTFVTADGEPKHFLRQDLEFSYRSSSFHKMSGAIVGATFHLQPSQTARTRQLEIISYRTQTQPYGAKSAGCMFLNPQEKSAGALIDKCGLKGFSIGKIKVSEMHANFLINEGKGKSEDVVKLMALIKEKVKQIFGIELKSEVCIIPYKANP